MADEILGETEWTVESYLALFEPGSPDYDLLKARAANLKRIVVKRVRTAAGGDYEDTEFVERSGIAYTIRTKL